MECVRGGGVLIIQGRGIGYVRPAVRNPQWLVGLCVLREESAQGSEMREDRSPVGALEERKVENGRDQRVRTEKLGFKRG